MADSAGASSSGSRGVTSGVPSDDSVGSDVDSSAATALASTVASADTLGALSPSVIAAAATGDAAPAVPSVLVVGDADLGERLVLLRPCLFFFWDDTADRAFFLPPLPLPPLAMRAEKYELTDSSTAGVLVPLPVAAMAVSGRVAKGVAKPPALVLALAATAGDGGCCCCCCCCTPLVVLASSRSAPDTGAALASAPSSTRNVLGGDG